MSEATPDPEAIAVVGGGLAGLTAARALARAGKAVRVFDKGRGVGGRTSTRRADGERAFDHGAQYFSASDDRFARQVADWVDAGVAAEWPGGIAAIQCEPGACRPADPPGPKTRYVGTPGMSTPARALAEEAVAAGAVVTAGVRVAPLKRGGGRWRLVSESGEPLGDFARVVVTTPAPQAAELLTPSPALSNAAKSVRMSGCWAAMAALDEPIDAGFDGAFVNGPPEATPLSWVARDGSKPGRPGGPSVGDAWVLHGSPAWSEANLEADADAALESLLAGFWRAIEQPPRKPAYADAHRWRYALPENPLEDRCLIDAGLGLYAAGDWCGGPKVEGAYLSGLAAASAILGE